MSISHSVFGRLVLQTRNYKSLFGKGLIYFHLQADTEGQTGEETDRRTGELPDKLRITESSNMGYIKIALANRNVRHDL